MPFRLKRPRKIQLSWGGIPSVSQGIDGAGWSVWEINHSGKSSAINHLEASCRGMHRISLYRSELQRINTRPA